VKTENDKVETTPEDAPRYQNCSHDGTYDTSQTVRAMHCSENDCRVCEVGTEHVVQSQVECHA
jgi:hypothetical protein